MGKHSASESPASWLSGCINRPFFLDREAAIEMPPKARHDIISHQYCLDTVASLRRNAMKRSTALVLVPALAAILTGCVQSPRSTAKLFTENISQGKLTEAKKHATEQTGQLIDMASSMGALPIKPGNQFIFIEQTIDGDKATVRYRSSEEGNAETINLVKVDGKWKVHTRK